ncbi:SGNH/GDSL hydrolase family protein [Lysinibacillus agricola]|uniref:SGNH/GDSL hydrolase family protein n=1 Tax=Lysinibacillus agricola TaxID=2590012 RepID=A0ABX7AQX5_9BACI|nr:MULTISPECIES: SGNH/GDSL hydrolase family protein [Lysinibacillus]KOS60061.1 lysophospholipase [Lysinibacillus sp. FJAT-14222]QQP11932.1 SGNH/GDSL hydrolase family protein [Lysinibacillus agricola]
MKRLLIIIGAAIFMMALGVSSAFAQTENYLSIGDSLAAGQTPYQQIDTGYSDLIAMRLGMTGQLSVYTKELAFPGFTTDDVLKRVKSEEASDLLADATLITISAGANDLLRLVQVNPSAGTLAFSQLQTDYALNVARKNMVEILEELKVRAPKSKVYVMGYYFAYPNVHATQKEGTNAQLIKLNTILQQQAEHAGATYVDVYNAFGLNATNLLPNISDVHPNFEGYRQMANAFLNGYSGSKALAISSNELPKPKPISFEQILEQQEKAEKKQEEKEKPTPTARTIQGFKGYAAFMEKVRAIRS